MMREEYTQEQSVHETCYCSWGVVAHTFNPSTQELEADGYLWVWGQPGLQSEFQDSQGNYTEKPCLEKKPVIVYVY